VRQALALLQAEGLIEKHHGAGNVVRKPRRMMQRPNERHQWEKNRVRGPKEVRESTGATERDTGLTIDDLVFSTEHHEAKADEELAAALKVPIGTRLVFTTQQDRW
jgi:GntR family transcriptional regulator